MKGFYFSVLLLSCFLTLSSCTPTLHEPTHTPPKTEFYVEEQEFQETEIQGGAEAFPMAWKGTVRSEDYFELANNLFQIAKATQNSRLKMTGLKLVSKLEKVNNLTPITLFKSTPFFEIIQNKAEPEVRSTILDVQKSLPEDLEKIKKLIEQLNTEFQWPEKSTIDQSIIWFESFMNQMILRVPRLKMNTRIEKALVEQLAKQSSENIAILKQSSQALKEEKTLSGAIRVIEDLIIKFEVQLDKETKNLLKTGKTLGKKIDTYKNADGALEALLRIWLMLDKKGRIENIKPVSPDLYDFLSDKSDDTVRCIITPGCFSPWQDFLTTFFVKPKLEDYGLEKLRRQLNGGTYAFTVEAVEKQVTATLPKLAQQITDKINQSVEKESKGLDEILSNVANFIQIKINKWGSDNLGQNVSNLSAYERDSLQVNMLPNLQFEVSADIEIKETTSAAIGSGLEAQINALSMTQKTEEQYLRTFLNQLDKVLGFGGIELKPAVFSQGLVRAFEKEAKKFDVVKATESASTYVIFDSLLLKEPFTARTDSATLNLNAKSQSLLLNGLLEFMDYMKDWLKNDFDKYLGHRDAGELFAEDGKPVEPVGKKLFPKDQFFSLAVAHVGSLLKNVTKEQTPFILFAETGERLWANQRSTAVGPVTMAGVVDVKNGERSDIVRSQNVSRWILSLAKFLQVSEGIENTKSEDLLKKGEDGRSAVDYINESRKQISDLIIALGNLLSSQMTRDGLVLESIKVKDLMDISSHYSLMDQLMAIDALLTVHEVTKMKSYMWTALDIYKALKETLNTKTNFFEVGGETTSNPVLTSFMVRSMNHLVPYLKTREQQFLRREIRIWSYKLEKMN